ncbi:hypothetical protein GOODEAATRI_010693 [Goodea atripinnis]|uniref:SH3 domain-containing protein n=1 Tax=Goodea atripinnis TaxID=208336 RepID=A0ABV0NJ52_9TELE
MLRHLNQLPLVEGQVLYSLTREVEQLWEELHHLCEVQWKYSSSPMDLAPPPLLINQLQEADDIALREGELVIILSLVVKQSDTSWAAVETDIVQHSWD